MVSGFFIAFSQSDNSRYVIKTEYFDVIYRKPSSNTAKMISENIDRIYLEIRESLNLEEYYTFKHFPVYIEYTTESLNAFFTDYPFRHIVFYDTVPGSTLMVFENTVLSIIRHELTHAVSMNVKNKGNQILSDIIYNGWGWLFWTAPSSIKEGIAVYEESEKGEGRLNNPFSMHSVKQAKIENRFPELPSITGARDIYPSGNVPYMFGGTFTDFVIKKYGKEKHKKFLEDLNNRLLNYPVIYRKIFNADIYEDWKEFIVSLSVPQVESDPYTTEGIYDFNSLQENNKRPFNNKKKTLITDTASFRTLTKTGNAWYDDFSSELWYQEKDNESGSVKTSLLLSVTNVTKIAFSSDGRYLAISRTLPFETYKTRVSIYDMEKKKLINCKEESLRDAVVISKDGSYFLCAVKTISQFCSVNIYNIEKNDFSLQKEIPFEYESVPFNLCDAGNLNLCYILKSGMNQSISLYNKELDESVLIAVPDGTVVDNLKSVVSEGFITGQKGILLAFSFGKNDSLVRPGFLSLKYNESKLSDVKFHLCTEDFSGGAFAPVLFSGTVSKKLPSIMFISKMFDFSKLSVMDTDSFEFEQIKADFKFQKNSRAVQEVPQSEEKEKKKFNPFEYTFRGIFAPVSLISYYDDQFEVKGLGLLGLTWHSKGYHLSAGYDPFTFQYGFTGSIFNSSPTENASFQLSAHSCFDEKGFRQTEEELKLKAAFPVLTHSAVVFSSQSFYFYGQSDKLRFFTQQDSVPIQSIFSNVESIRFSTVHKSGSGFHEKKGFYAGLLCSYTNINIFDTKKRSGQGINAGLDAGFYLSRVLPFENPQGITCNLPLNVSGSLFPDISRFASIAAEAVLFSVEVQKGTKKFFVPLYLNRLYVKALYKGSFYYREYQNMAFLNLSDSKKMLSGGTYADAAGLGVNIAFTLNTGDLHKLGVIDLGVNVLFDINSRSLGTERIHINLSSNLVF